MKHTSLTTFLFSPASPLLDVFIHKNSAREHERESGRAASVSEKRSKEGERVKGDEIRAAQGRRAGKKKKGESSKGSKEEKGVEEKGGEK
jgi:hypothetical protein